MTKTAKQFEGLLDRYFEGLLRDHPIYAASVGLQSGEGKLDSAATGFLKRRERLRQEALRALEKLSPRELTNEQHLDRLAFRALLVAECEDFARRRYTLDPRAPQTLLGVLLREVQRSEDEPARAAKNLRGVLRETPRFLGEAVGLIGLPEPTWRRVMDQTAAGAGALFAAVTHVLQRVTPKPGDAVLLREAQRALEVYRSMVVERPAAPAGAFAIGAETLQRRVRDELGLDYTLGEIEALALGEAERIGALLRRECARFGRKRSPEDIIADLRSQWRPAQPLLELYREQTRRVADGFKAARAMTFPEGDELEVRPVPDFLRNLIPTAAYDPPGALERRRRGIFWVNDLSATKTSAAEKLAEQQQHFGVALTCAHEAYPGHHLQFVTAYGHPRKWRRLFAHAVFYEGWTLWCEQMMADLRLDRAPWLRVQQLHDALWRVHRILVDLRLQTGSYRYEQAVAHLRRHLGFTEARAQADVNWYTGAPGVPMSYWLGRLENERLRQRLMAGRGWSLRRFNDWLLSFGTLPQAWIEKYGLD